MFFCPYLVLHNNISFSFMFSMECIFPFGCGVFAWGKKLNNRCFDILEFFMLFKVSVGWVDAKIFRRKIFAIDKSIWAILTYWNRKQRCKSKALDNISSIKPKSGKTGVLSPAECVLFWFSFNNPHIFVPI